jgi:hexosaminidase
MISRSTIFRSAILRHAQIGKPPSPRPCRLLVCALLAAPTLLSAQSAPILSPQPRELHPAALLPIHTARILAPSGDIDDLFTAQNLTPALIQRGLKIAPPNEAADLTILLLRDTTPEAQSLLAAENLSFDAPMHDEGYILVLRPSTPSHIAATLIAPTSAGLFYAAQTLKQLIETAPTPKVWTGTIRDWPAMKYRGVHDDLSRGPFPTLAFQKHQLEVFAEHKINLYSPYFEHTLQYAADPLAAPPGSFLTRADSRELAAYARQLHILIVPEQESFGHLHHVLQFEKYTDLAETPHGHVLAPSQPATQPLILSWFTQIAADFPSPFLHIGADETFELGTGRTKAAVDTRGLGPVYADFLTSIHTTLAPLHRRLLFWGDIAVTDPAAIARLPHDMIAIPWGYDREPSYDRDILPFKAAGMETWVAPGDSNWKQVYPLGRLALDNISGFIESGQRLGSTGELTTVWDDDGEGLFNQDWFGVLFGAAAGWQPGKSDAATYEAAFGPTVFGDTTGNLNAAQTELLAAQDLIDVSNETFWLDPWSPAGLAKANKLRAKIPAARLHAEHTLALLEALLETAPTNPSLRENDAIAAMELGARRIDFIGLKFQLSDEMRDAYAKAYAARADAKHKTATRDILDSISSMNGRCQDLRDGYSLLKDLYRASWLAENRPAWLDNVLVRYDMRIALWQQRGEALQTLTDTWDDTQSLPTPSQANIPPPPTASTQRN